MITKFIISMFRGMPQMFREHKVAATIYALIIIVIYVVTSRMAYKHFMENSKATALRNFLVVLYLIINFIRFAVLFMIGFASEYTKLNEDFITKGFLIEILILCVVVGVFYCIKLKNSGDSIDDEAMDEFQEAVGKVIKAVIVFICSLIFIFTNLEHSIRGFGFSLFGKRLGEWLYNFYCTASVEFILGIFATIVASLFSILVGSQSAQFKQAMKDAERKIDRKYN